MSQTIQGFFEEFQRCNAAGDVEQLARLYAPVFMVAGANGAQAVRSADLALMIPKRKQMLEAIGCGPASLVSLEETRLDDRYSMVKARWQWRVKRGEAEPVDITLGSIVILQRTAEGSQIVFYLNQEDIVTVLRERGLLAANT